MGIWCPPCKKEMPYIERQHKAFEGKGVNVLSINIAESGLKVETFRDQYGLTFPIAIDKGKSVMGVYNVGILRLDTSYNKDGRIEQIITREMSEDEIITFMESIQPE